MEKTINITFRNTSQSPLTPYVKHNTPKLDTKEFVSSDGEPFSAINFCSFIATERGDDVFVAENGDKVRLNYKGSAPLFYVVRYNTATRVIVSASCYPESSATHWLAVAGLKVGKKMPTNYIF